ncbi:MAG: sugar phosphate isomerase/epimerase [Clostridia bacterium]|nr:sugar phosphate isomerase/epimerase [Clostridia bacterium]
MRLCAFADEASEKLGGQIDALRRNGISLLEIRGVNGKNIKDLTSAEVREVKAALDGAGISVWSIGSPIGKISLADDFAVHTEDFKRILEAADTLGAKKIRAFSFFPVKGMEAEAVKAAVCERIEALLALTPAHITLCHENEKEIFGENTENCLFLHRTFPRLQAVFDPANFVQCGVDTASAWEALREYVDYLHIKDAVADGTVVPAGMGIGNVTAIVGDYLARGGEVMTLEPHLFDFTGLSALENGKSLKLGISAYRNNDEAFDAAASALKTIIGTIGKEA